MSDEAFLCDKCEDIYNEVFCAMNSLCADELEWNISLIGDVTSFIENYLTEKGFNVCYPFQDGDGNICYASSDRCKYCKKRSV